MKRMLAMILCFALLLCGCGNSATETTPVVSEEPAEQTVAPPVEVAPVETAVETMPKQEKIEITTENWDDYFQIIYEPSARLNAFNELEKLYIYCNLVPREEYTGRIDISSSFGLELSYVAGDQGCQFSDDFSSFELVGDFSYTKDVTHIVEWKNGCSDLIARHTVDYENNIIVAYCKDFEATRAEGYIILTN